jgi:predicted DNA-binding transcriptional regulator YafY
MSDSGLLKVVADALKTTGDTGGVYAQAHAVVEAIEKTRIPVWIKYRNHRGETSWRHVLPERMWCGETQWHEGRQWFLHALDLSKGLLRDFAMADILEWETYR